VTDTRFDVFINCPFDSEYRSLFAAILFTVAACGYRARCALEVDDGIDIRFDKLCRLIDESPRSIHDLSRTELNKDDLPRFNMPFELGLLMGAKRFGGKRHKHKTALILIREPYRLPAYLSDLGGNDPTAHHGQVAEVVRLVRRYLHVRPGEAPLPGAQHLLERFTEFQSALPELARAARINPDEIDPFDEYRDYVCFVSAFLKLNPVI
jgi:hypothetical protein